MIGRAARTFLGVPIIALAVIPFGLAIALAGDTERSERFLRRWCRLVLFIAGARVVARVHPLDRSRSYVFVSNHTSNIDVPAIVSISPEPLRFVAKQELGRIPLFGWAARRMGHVFIDRRDSHGAARTIAERIGRGLQGIGLFFFAEGTRSTTGDLLPFKKGAAVAALTTGLDCVPIGVAGAREVLAPKGFSLFRPGPIAVVFGAPIPVSGHTMDDRDRLVAEQRTAVEACVREARGVLEKERSKRLA
ncbi:MAG TPA: lysophospholipid acyltransferase family protein [Myxococcales bacterium]|nr:lysophospholipid acyltransferase family protein [Myxococcales bacterium]